MVSFIIETWFSVHLKLIISVFVTAAAPLLLLLFSYSLEVATTSGGMRSQLEGFDPWWILGIALLACQQWTVFFVLDRNNVFVLG